MKPATIKLTIAFADFEKLDVRVGTILTVEAIPGADTLMKLTVDLGDATRTVLAGIKGERDDPTQIIGKQALFVINLEPRRMMGQVSEGMLFDLGYADGIAPCLSVPEHSVPNGTRAG